VRNYHRQIEHVRPRQELSEREHVDKLPIGEPALALNQLTACPKNCTAEAGQANPGKSQEQLESADGRIM
jgi:hypothetical protein